jgi:cellulose synthase/poly-beta-1,6-N-acetylglucosamine synthase-like glycosyltransferase
MTFFSTILIVFAIVLFFPVFILVFEVICALFNRSKENQEPWERVDGLQVAVLVPAHNEAEGISFTVSGILGQLLPHDRLVVIADNCTDSTAHHARGAGAETIIRDESVRRGKGYALDFGMQHLASKSPDFVIVIDADCQLEPGTINMLVSRSSALNRPVQALYSMDLPVNSDAKRRVAGFAWTVKNHLRPRGLSLFGLPCQLMGTGMAFPWEAIRGINLATANIVEDVKMGLDLAARGFAPVYCQSARVKSSFPASESGFSTQRQRWESGALHNLMATAPVALAEGLITLNWPLMVMAIDLMVPPLMLLLSVLLLGLVLSVLFAVVGGSVIPAGIFAGLISILFFVLFVSWQRFGRDVLRAQDFLSFPAVFVRKIGFYFTMLRNRGAGWIRTDRK